MDFNWIFWMESFDKFHYRRCIWLEWYDSNFSTLEQWVIIDSDMGSVLLVLAMVHFTGWVASSVDVHPPRLPLSRSSLLVSIGRHWVLKWHHRKPVNNSNCKSNRVILYTIYLYFSMGVLFFDEGRSTGKQLWNLLARRVAKKAFSTKNRFSRLKRFKHA